MTRIATGQPKRAIFSLLFGKIGVISSELLRLDASSVV